MITCPRCQGCLVQQWNVELRCNDSRCIACGHYPTWPTKDRPVENRGKHARESCVHSCRCGRPKVSWRSVCAKCLIQVGVIQPQKH